MTKKTWLIVLFIVIAFRIVYFFVSFFADAFLPYAPTFAYAFDKLPNYGFDRWLYSWSNFDGVHYLTIVEKGYLGTGLIQAFFPVYPVMVWLANLIVRNTLLSSLWVSNIATGILIYWMYHLLKEKSNSVIAWYSVAVFLLFPSAFFLFAAYGESLFLLLVVGSFWYLHKKQWLLMSLCIAGAAGTRIVGIFLVPAIMIELLVGSSYRLPSIATVTARIKNNAKPLLYTALGSIGLISYMIYLWYTFDDPLFFWHVQSEFGGGREERIILLPQTIWRYLKIFMTVPVDLRWITYFQEFFFGVVPLIALVYFWLKQRLIPHSWALFSIAALLLPTLTGTFSSMPRYALAAFPLYLCLGIAYNQNPKLRWGLILSAIVLLFNTVLFIQGYWIA